MEKPAVLHVLTSQAWGGLELYVLQLIKELYKTDQKIALYCIAGSKVDTEAKKLGIKIYYGVKNARFSPKDIFRVRKILKNESFNIIHSHSKYDVWLVSLSLIGLPYKKHVFSLYMSAQSKKDFLHKFIFSKVTTITSSSTILNDNIVQKYPVSASQVSLLRYGRDLSIYKNDKETRKTTRNKFGCSDDDIIVASMCRIDAAKGLKEIASSLLSLNSEIKKKVKIWLIGEPTLSYTDKNGSPVYEEEALNTYNWLQNFIKKPEIENRIQLIPFQRDYIPVLSSIDIFVLATYKETYSLAVLDAMAMGLPVIGTNSGGTPEQIKDHERGLLVAPKSADDIAKAITTYVTHPELMAAHGEQAKKWCYSEHNWEHTLMQLNNIYLN